MLKLRSVVQRVKHYSLETHIISAIHVCGLNLNGITLILKLELDMVVTYLHAKMGSVGQRVQRLWLRNTNNLMLFMHVILILTQWPWYSNLA